MPSEDAPEAARTDDHDPDGGPAETAAGPPVGAPVDGDGSGGTASPGLGDGEGAAPAGAEPIGPGPGGPGPGGPGPDGDPDGGRETRRRRLIVEMVAVVAVAAVAALLLRAFVVQTYYIPSGSMLPTLQVGDRIVVDKLSYRLHGVGRGDIVVFARPPAEDCPGPRVQDLVKRIIGLPGDVVSAVDGHVDIDGRPLAEPWLSYGEPTEAVDDGRPYDLTRPYRVPAGEYFVMGDNRTDSCDSRYWGPVPRGLLVGRVVLRIWPLAGLHFF